MKTPKIISIPEKMQGFYGSGTMLHPEKEMVAEFIGSIPPGKVITIDDLAKKLAITFGADVTCPMRTGNQLKRLSKEKSTLPFWRVVRTNGLLIKFDDQAHWATVLEAEGFTLYYTKSNQVQIRPETNQRYAL